MAGNGRFHSIFTEFSKQKKVALAGLIGATSTLLTYVWHYSSNSCLNAEVVPNKNDDAINNLDTSLSDNTEGLQNENQIIDSKYLINAKQSASVEVKKKQFKSSTVNLKYKGVAPKLYSIIHQIKEVCGSPGISYAIAHDGELVMQGGIGLADVENYALCTSETIMRIASISKSLTSVAIGKLIEEGVIDINKPVQTYVPKFPQKKFDGEDVTITTKQLLSHSSGIRGYFDGNRKLKQKKGKEPKPLDDKAKRKHEIEVKKYGEECINSDENYIMKHYKSVEDGLSLFQDDPLIYKPGTDYEYSSLAYSLVSRVIEEISGEDYITYMNNICEDLGMHYTKVDLNEPIVYKRGRSYKRKKGVLQNVRYVDNSYKWSGGGLLSNVEDLLKLGNMLLYSSQTDQGYLKKSTVATLWHPEPISIGKCNKKKHGYALGWVVKPRKNNEKLSVYHTGGAAGVSSILLMVPDGDGSSSSTDNHPRGTVIALIVNMQSVSLTEAAHKISRCLEDHCHSQKQNKC